MRRAKTLFTGAFALLFILSLSSFISLEGGLGNAKRDQTVYPDDVLKSNALRVLQLKCNTCHVRQNPGKVFTTSNMNTLAPQINEQVFVRKRMPRGKRLTKEEYAKLQNWIDSQNIK